ncbi:MAG: hypothetical protein ACI9X0_002984 [Kiritimatiellia bacterium]|jgi:hypothetical protein
MWQTAGSGLRSGWPQNIKGVCGWVSRERYVVIVWEPRRTDPKRQSPLEDSLRLNYEGTMQRPFVVQSKRGTSGDCLKDQPTRRPPLLLL